MTVTEYNYFFGKAGHFSVLVEFSTQKNIMHTCMSYLHVHVKEVHILRC